MINLKEIQKIIGYNFKDEELLKLAFTHSSFSEENNERLEFMGDTVLDLVVADILFDNPKIKEGELTKKRAILVCEKNLSAIVKNFKLQNYIVFGKSFQGEISNAICGDLFEAIVGAIYLDSNKDLANVRTFVKNFINLESLNQIDYKSSLQEIVQKKKDFSIEYRTRQLEENVPDFECELFINGTKQAVARGRTKKQAEINSAQIVYEKIEGRNQK
jgi:ribonuclease III